MSAPDKRKWLVVSLVTLWLLPGSALAKDAPPSDSGDLLGRMLVALDDGDYSRVTKLNKRNTKILLAAEEPVSAKVQAEISLVAGLALWSDGDPDRAMDAWRVALRLDPDQPWQPGFVDDGDAETVFCALRREVKGNKRVSPSLPEDTGATRIWIAGQRATPELRVPAGTYLVQAHCPDGVLRNQTWHTNQPLDAGSMCPDGLGEATVADKGCDEVVFDMFGNPVDACEQGPVAQVELTEATVESASE